MSKKAAGPPTLSILWMFDSEGERRHGDESGVTMVTLLICAKNKSPNFSFFARLADLLKLSGMVTLEFLSTFE